MRNIQTLFFLIALSISINAQTLITHDFEDGFGPYEINKNDQVARVNIVDGAVVTHWQQELYNGTNSGRKAQIKPINDIIFTQHIWMGLKLKIHDDYMRDNVNTNAGLMQIWGNDPVRGSANHMCMLKFDGRNGGALVWQHRYNSVSNMTHYLVKPNFPRNEFVDIIVHVHLNSLDAGVVQIWVDEELVIDESNQRIGWGEMDETGMINGTHCFGTSLGQYNFFVNAADDDAYDGTHSYDGHMEGETRTVTYDNVALYNGVDGYDLVNPRKDESSSCGNFDAYSTIEGEDYCEMQGVTIAGDGTSVGSVHTGDWILYEGVNFGEIGAAGIELSLGKAHEGLTQVHVHLDDLSSDSIAVIDVPYTGGWHEMESVMKNLPLITGTHDIYLSFVSSDSNAVGNVNSLKFFERKNLALDGTTDQSSLDHGGVSSRAIDGEITGLWNEDSVTHTKYEESPWWTVTLKEEISIGDIVIYNRTDSCCIDRLANFLLTVIDEEGRVTFSKQISDYPDSSITVNAGGATGKKLQIELMGTDVLSLAEVEVYSGYEKSPYIEWLSNYSMLSDATNHGDPDRDRIPTLIEYVIGGTPENKDLAPLSTKAIKLDGENVISLKRNRISKLDTRQFIEYGGDLENWSRIDLSDSNNYEVDDEESDTDIEAINITISQDEEIDGRLYWRLLVETAF